MRTAGTALFSACADAASVVTALLAAAYEFTGTRRGVAQRADLSVRENMMICVVWWEIEGKMERGIGTEEGFGVKMIGRS